MFSAKTDCFVVGGGPAGLATAIAARMQGLSVVVADPERPPIDKTCGEGLMPDALSALAALGVEICEEHGAPFRGIRFAHGDTRATADFPCGGGVGIRRVALHAQLIARAEACGVRMLWGTRVTGVVGHVVEIDGRSVEARFIVGADGQQSRVRKWAGLEAEVRHSRRFGFRRHYGVAPWSEFMEIHWGRRCQVYVTPVGPREVCVALISRDPRLRLEEGLAEMPEVARHLSGAPPTSAERGGVSATRRLWRVSAGNIALVGDASGSIDAITGTGLCLSFQQAMDLARAMRSGTLGGYGAMHRRGRFRVGLMSDALLLLDRFDWARDRAIRAMAARQEIFGEMVKMHVGESAPAAFLRHGALPLGWGMLWARP